MDLLTHAFVGFSIRYINRVQTNLLTLFSLLGATLPDIGEIVIQNALSKKYGENMSVYDSRTSDIEIASQIGVTRLYDISHSFFTTFLFLIVGYTILKYAKKENIYVGGLCLLWFGFGQFSHVCLDSFTHGKVWALKLFYPISNHRFLILSDTVGNWWEWKPSLTSPFFGFTIPMHCLIVWISFLVIIFYKKR